MKYLTSVRAKLLLIVMGSLLILSMAAVSTTSRLSANLSEYHEVQTVVVEAQKLALMSNLEFKRQVQEWKNTLIRGADPEKMDKYWGRFNSRHESTQQHVNDLIPLLEEWPELQAIAEQFLVDHTLMQKAYSDGRDQYIAASYDIAVGDSAVSGIDRAPSAALDDLVEKLSEIADTRTTIVESNANNSVRLGYFLVIVILVIVAVLSYILFDRIFVRPLSQVNRSLSAVAEGDLTLACEIDRNDEIGEIADSACKLQQFLQDNVRTMKDTASALQDASQHIATMSDQLGAQSQDQMEATDQVATAIQEMSHSADEVAGNSQQTSDITQLANGKANDGKRSVNAAQQRAVTLVSDLNASAEVIKDLAENAANVSNVLDVIRGIAEQTNLLALNAAIEAARAGEQGRGFAVVADEVRTLAQRTQDSTAEIENILDSVKSGADKAVISMETGQNRSQEVETEITQSSDLLNEISGMVEDINAKNVQIATAATEQTAVTSSISELMQNIHGLAEQATDQVSKTQSVSAQLADLVSEFEAQIAKFKV